MAPLKIYLMLDMPPQADERSLQKAYTERLAFLGLLPENHPQKAAWIRTLKEAWQEYRAETEQQELRRKEAEAAERAAAAEAQRLNRQNQKKVQPARQAPAVPGRSMVWLGVSMFFSAVLAISRCSTTDTYSPPINVFTLPDRYTPKFPDPLLMHYDSLSTFRYDSFASSLREFDSIKKVWEADQLKRKLRGLPTRSQLKDTVDRDTLRVLPDSAH